MYFYFPFCFWDIHWWQTAPLPLRNLNIFFMCWSKYKCRDMFGICTCWGFPKHPQHIKVHEVFTEIFLIKDKWYDSRYFKQIDNNRWTSHEIYSFCLQSNWFNISHWLLKKDHYWHRCPSKQNYFSYKKFCFHEIFMCFYQLACNF